MANVKEVIGIQEISIEKIDEFKYRTRFTNNEQKDIELSESIKENGVINPLIVKEDGDGFSLIGGFRRLNALRKNGMKSAPCYVREFLNDTVAFSESVIDNIHRDNYHPIDEANVFNDLKDKNYAKNNKDLSKRFNISEARVSQKLSLLSLEPVIQKRIGGEFLSETHGIQLSRVKDGAKQVKFAELVIKNGLSVSQLKAKIDRYLDIDNEIAEKLGEENSKDGESNKEKTQLKREFSEHINLKVKNDSYQITINVKDTEKLEEIMEEIDVDEMKKVIKGIRKLLTNQ